jgi:lysophospholipase L1-like esterase
MKPFYIIAALLTGFLGYSQTDSYKFDFGSGRAPQGYLNVTPQTIYSEQTGYGFEPGTVVEAVTHEDKNVTSDFITGRQPFYFSVRLPEGNYDVKVILGDIRGTSATTVRAESRRLMLENVKTPWGRVTEQTFTVHLRDSLIRDKGKVTGQVCLKKNENLNFHWDNVLTLEFNDSLPKICAVEIMPNKKATTIFLAGDSTVCDQPGEPYASWGQMFPVFLVPGKVALANYAESGETLKAFENEKRLAKIWSMAKPGDYLFIEFTHNDQKDGPNHLDANTTFKGKVKEWVAEAKRRGMVPVLVTSTHRRKFDAGGHIENTLLEYPEALRQTAKETGVALIDLNASTKMFYEALGVEDSKKSLVHYPANTYPNQPKALEDNTHFNPYGAYQLAGYVMQGIRAQKLPLAKFIKKEVPVFNPAKPTPPASFYWPQSGVKNSRKPDGN